MEWSVKITAGKGRGREFEIPETAEARPVDVGRAAFCNVSLADLQMSRRHCQFLNEDGRLYVEDLGSTNGTKVNGRTIREKTRLGDGDEISVGSHVLTVEGDEEAGTGHEERQREHSLERERPRWKLLDLEGKKYGALKVKEKLYEGPASVLYRVYHPKSDRVCTLRIVREDTGISVEHKNRYIRGAKYAGQVRHPNLIGIHRGGKHHGTFYVLTEYVEGQNLENMVRERSEPMEVKDALQVTSQVLAALQAVYEGGYVHRNVTPDNILVQEDLTVRLTDFELVEPLPDGSESAITRVMESRIKVDPGFSSPDLIMHPVSCDQRSDLFGAGACLYFMLTRRAPFPGQLPAGDMSRLFKRRFTAPRKLNENVPSAVSTLLSTALAAHAEDRYREPADMKDQVDSVLEEM